MEKAHDFCLLGPYFLVRQNDSCLKKLKKKKCVGPASSAEEDGCGRDGSGGDGASPEGRAGPKKRAQAQSNEGMMAFPAVAWGRPSDASAQRGSVGFSQKDLWSLRWKGPAEARGQSRKSLRPNRRDLERSMPARRRLPQGCHICWLLCAFTLKLCGRLEPAVLAGGGLRGGGRVCAVLPFPGQNHP